MLEIFYNIKYLGNFVFEAIWGNCNGVVIYVCLNSFRDIYLLYYVEVIAYDSYLFF